MAISLSEKQNDTLNILKIRFDKNISRHPQIKWEHIEEKLLKTPYKIDILKKMEDTGGEPDVVKFEKDTNSFIFFDCAVESPKGRRSICYDHQALLERKEHQPVNSAINMAEEIGIKILNEEQYKFLQTLGDFDLKTSSWIETPPAIRKLGGAIFGDKRYNNVFIYHNGAQSYYGARGFRGYLIV